jgi:hypothetical protein
MGRIVTCQCCGKPVEIGQQVVQAIEGVSVGKGRLKEKKLWGTFHRRCFMLHVVKDPAELMKDMKLSDGESD